MKLRNGRIVGLIQGGYRFRYQNLPAAPPKAIVHAIRQRNTGSSRIQELLITIRDTGGTRKCHRAVYRSTAELRVSTHEPVSVRVNGGCDLPGKQWVTVKAEKELPNINVNRTPDIGAGPL